MKNKKINIALFSGGRGSRSLIKQIKKYPNINLTSIVNPYDDGKSTGKIRYLFNIHGPSDFRKIHEILIDKNNSNYQLLTFIFKYRFYKNITDEKALYFLNNFKSECKKRNLYKSSKLFQTLENLILIFLNSFENIKNENKVNFDFKDCSLTNILYAAILLKFKNNINKSLKYIENIFEIPGSVISITNENAYLCGIRDSGEILQDEASIVELRSNIRIKSLFLMKKKLNTDKLNKLNNNSKIKYLNKISIKPKISSEVIKKIRFADIIIYSPGTQHSSLLPTYMSNKFDKLITSSDAKKIFVTNIGADYETPNYKASEYILNAYKYINHDKNYKLQSFFEYNLINENNNQSKKKYVNIDYENLKKIKTNNIFKDFERIPYKGIHSGKKILDEVLNIYFNC